MALTSSIQAKFALIIGVFVLAMGMTAGATLYVAETQTFDAAVIDVAARQPLLATEMAASTQALIAALESESSVEKAHETLSAQAELFGYSLTALHEGGEITAGGGEPMMLPPSEGHAREALDRVVAAWAGYRRSLDVLLGADVDVTSDAFYDTTDALPDQQSAVRAAAAAAVHPLKESSQAKVALMKRVVWLSVLATLVVAAASWMFTHRKVLSPIRQLARTIRNIEQTSDLSQRLEVGSRDEIGRTAEAFNRMLTTFQQTVNEVAGTVNQLEDAAANLSDVTECGRRSTGQQQSDIEKVASAMHELEMSAGEVVRNTDEAATSAEGVNRDAEEGSAVVDRTMESIRALAESVQRAADVMHDLEQDTTGIGSILDVIRGISEQTNLLALNAAIEAARAGEQGRGFAVVADEVRVLAQRTQASTEEIQDMIQRLQTGAKDVAQVMDEGRARVEKSVDQAAQTRVALTHITDAVTAMSDMNRQIASAAREQGAVTGDLSQNIVRIKEEADETATVAERTASAGMLLAEKAGHLKSLVSRFKV